MYRIRKKEIPPSGIRCKICIFLLLIFFIVPSLSLYSNDFIAGYHLGENWLLLGESMQNTEGELKPFESMTPSEIATLYHELWHAWFIRAESERKGTVYRRMAQNLPRLYAEYPEEKRMEIYEEAVADFIDAMIATYVQVKRYLDSKPAEQQINIIENTPYLQNTYGCLFGERYNGYYTKSIGLTPDETSDTATTPTVDKNEKRYEALSPEKILGTFIKRAGGFGLPTNYLREAVNALDGVVFLDLEKLSSGAIKADVEFAHVFLDTNDMDMIIQYLFENKLTRNPRDVFSPERIKE